ncbi:MAG TPA: YbhB/YbcL family Raf kinase inhibitor-like protein [Candidatus Nanoarchaeia archaeon]|nr:YbhB/YbcL family Raf kinase inhibitor-like protein [Candidatus Nanoarchaeia archaeon]
MLTLTSPAFRHNSEIPAKYTCRGQDINPQLDILGVPKNAKSLVLIVDDPDAPMGMWVHWVVWNIPIVTSIKENSIPGVQGMNDFGKKDYGGPCPPSGTHRYFFKLYALDTTLTLREGRKKDVEKAMEGHIIEKTVLVGLYKKK